MKRILFSVILLIVSVAIASASGLELDTGAIFDFNPHGIPMGFDAGASYGAGLSVNYFYMQTDIEGFYRKSYYEPVFFRMSVSASFDFWHHLRLAMGFGNSLVLLRDDQEYSVAWSDGVLDGNPFTTPLFFRFETSFLAKDFKIGLIFNISTPLIVSKNNWPDIIEVFKDKDMALNYLMSSSVALAVQWRFAD